jgi:hypothetical protein
MRQSRRGTVLTVLTIIAASLTGCTNKHNGSSYQYPPIPKATFSAPANAEDVTDVLTNMFNRMASSIKDTNYHGQIQTPEPAGDSTNCVTQPATANQPQRQLKIGDQVKNSPPVAACLADNAVRVLVAPQRFLRLGAGKDGPKRQLDAARHAYNDYLALVYFIRTNHPASARIKACLQGSADGALVTENYLNQQDINGYAGDLAKGKNGVLHAAYLAGIAGKHCS